MKRLLSVPLVLLLSTQISLCQSVNCPPNIDFESGTLDHWDCFTGHVDAVGGANVISLQPSSPTANRHEIMDSANNQLDPYGNFPTVCPYGGRYSVKLGNNDFGKEAEGISYTFQIPPLADTFSLTYYYAVVFEDPGHTAIEQPRFFVTAYDVLTGRVIDCASYNYISNGSIPGFKVSDNGSQVLYKEWSPSSIDFSGLAGRMVRLEFTTADCTIGGHFGYAYLDVGTGCGGVMAVGAYCIETNSVTLNAPYGFKDYTWYNATYDTIVASTRTVSLTPPPSISSVFHVDMVPYPGYGCRDTAHALLTVLPVPEPPVADSIIYYCQYDFPSEINATPISGNELIWYTSEFGGIPSNITPRPTTSTRGITDYWVTQKKFFGCESPRKKIRVKVSPTPSVSFTVNSLRQCQDVNRFVINNTTTNIEDSTIYDWDFGDGQKFTGRAPAPHVYANYGSFTISLSVNNSSCIKYYSQTITVVPKPVAAYNYPPVICEFQTPVQFTDISSVPGGISNINTWWWQINGNVSAAQNPASFTRVAGQLPVKLVVTSTEGCRSDTNSIVHIVHYSPLPAFSFGSLLCNNEVIRFKDLSKMPAGAGSDVVSKWEWWYDNVSSSTVQNPANLFAAGMHRIKMVAETNMGCKYRFADSGMLIYPKPNISLNITDSCVFRHIVYTAAQTTPVAVDKWYWDFGKGLTEGAPSFTKHYVNEGDNSFTLLAKTVHQCKDTIIRPFMIYRNRSKALRDTLVAKDEPLQLLTGADSNMDWYKWTPATGLSKTDIKNPVAIYDLDQWYELNTMTKQGCEGYSRVLVRRYKGPELWVANAFTPNNDGNNDVLHVLPVGIHSFSYFKIYNRRGQLMFETTNYYKGWDGSFNGARMDPANYVWVARAIDYKGNVMIRKGNVLLLR